MKAIKRAIILAMCLCLLAGTVGAFAETYKARQIARCDEYVNLREAPDSKSRSLERVYIGEVVMATPYNSAFSYCCYNGQYGYIRSEYLSSDIQPWSDGAFRVANCREYISLRKMPMKGAEVKTRIPLGATLDKVYYHDGGDTTDSFVYVKYNGQYGFVLWDYLAPAQHDGGDMEIRQIDWCDEYVNLREAPDSKSRSLERVYIGEVVMASRYDNTYSYCCYNGKFGFIRSEYLNASIRSWSDATFTVVNCKEYISLRRMPLKSADVLARIPLGTTLKDVYFSDGGDKTDTFVCVKYKGQYGFVLWDYLEALLYNNDQ